MTLPTVAWAQATPPPPAPPPPPASEPIRGPSPIPPGAAAPASEAQRTQVGPDGAPIVPPAEPPRVTVSAGAPQPPSQNLASPLPAKEPETPTQAVVRVGGGFILLYSNNYGPDYDLGVGGRKKKHLMDVWRASIVLDAKINRYGMHIEFRARDRGLRWMPVNSWLEEMYASVDILQPTNKFGPLVLKVGKEYSQFGKFWDNSFYGSMAFRDGLKLDPAWGFSFEGVLGAKQPLGMRYFLQYFINDGQIGNVPANRDTISLVQPGTTNSPIGGRRRERFLARLEPFYKFSPTSVVRVGASIEHFIADFPDTQSDAVRASNPRLYDIDNTNKVLRYGFDLTAQVAWFGAWAEWIRQEGQHTNAYPIAPVAANATAMTAGRAGRGYDKADWMLAGGNFTWSRYTIQYNYNQSIYQNIEALDAVRAGQAAPRQSQKEWIHNPSLQIALNEQIRLIFETPFWFRRGVAGLLRHDAEELPARINGNEKELIERQFLWTLHGKF